MTFFGEAVKACSNISYIFITINRYMLIGKEHSSALETISKWKINYVVGGSVVFSLLINIGHVFQYRINYGWQGAANPTLYESYPAIVVDNFFFVIYSFLYFLLSFCLFFVVNTSVEVSIVQKVRQEIAEKRVKTEEEIRNIKKNNSSCSAVVNKVLLDKQRKIEQDAKKEQRAIIMVVVNSFVNFVFRIPEILVFIASITRVLIPLINMGVDQSEIEFSKSLFYGLAGVILSLSYLAYLLTLTTNVVIYYLFNVKFKQLFIFWCKCNGKNKK
jgi:hypothetical protein